MCIEFRNLKLPPCPIQFLKLFKIVCHNMLSFGLAVGRVQRVYSLLCASSHFDSHFLSGFSSISSQVFNLTKLKPNRLSIGCDLGVMVSFTVPVKTLII